MTYPLLVPCLYTCIERIAVWLQKPSMLHRREHPLQTRLMVAQLANINHPVKDFLLKPFIGAWRDCVTRESLQRLCRKELFTRTLEMRFKWRPFLQLVRTFNNFFPIISVRLE